MLSKKVLKVSSESIKSILLKPAAKIGERSEEAVNRLTSPMGLLSVETPRDEAPHMNSLSTSAKSVCGEPSPNLNPDIQFKLLKSYVDSGAARSVCPTGFGEQFGLIQTPGSRNGEGFKTATGKRVSNKGGRTIVGHTDFGTSVSMKYAVADINVALDSVSQICDTGAQVVFRKTGGNSWAKRRPN